MAHQAAMRSQERCIGRAIAGVRRWAEQDDGSGSFMDWYLGGCSAQNETHRYWQQALFTGAQWVVRSNIDTIIIHQSLFNPFANWAQPFQVAYSAESYYAINHLPGSSSVPEDYSSMRV